MARLHVVVDWLGSCIMLRGDMSSAMHGGELAILKTFRKPHIPQCQVVQSCPLSRIPLQAFALLQ